MKLTIETKESVITVDNSNISSKDLQEVISIVTGLRPSIINPEEAKATIKPTVSARAVKLQFDVEVMSKQADVDLRTCCSVHKLVTSAPSFVVGLKQKGFYSLVEWMFNEGWLHYQPSERSLRSYYNKAQRVLRY